MQGNRYRSWINGVAASDFTDDVDKSGFIGLQVHGIAKGEGPYQVRWRNVRIQELKPGEEVSAPEPPEGFQAVFNGRDLTGWEGSPNYWSVEDGCLTGKADGTLKFNRFIIWRGGTVRNFELRVKVKVSPTGNSGLQYRGTERPDLGESVVTGYQCDVVANRARLQRHALRGAGPPHPGPHGREGRHRPEGQPWVVGQFPLKEFQPGEWHDYRVLAEGNHQRHWIDGHPTVDVIDLDEKGRKLDGVLAVQVHVGPPMTIRYKDFLPEGVARRPAADPARAGHHPARCPEGRPAGPGQAQEARCGVSRCPVAEGKMASRYRRPQPPKASISGAGRPTAHDAVARLRALGSPEAAAFAARYFKTGPGQYGEGDIFLGIRVPVLRKLTAEFRALPEDEVLSLLGSEFHEARLLALLIWVRAATKGDEATRRRVYDLYLTNTRSVNNWDLVDASARDIVGAYLHDKDRALSLPPGAVGERLGASDRHRRHPPLHRPARVRRHDGDRRDAPRRPARPDPQGDGLDAARGSASGIGRPWKSS